MKLGVKAKRNIGLIAVTVVIIAAIILVVCLVQKHDDDSKLKYGHVGQVVSTSQADVHVKVWRIVENLDGYTVEDGKCVYLMEVEIKANKKITVSSEKFEIKDAKKLTAKVRQGVSSGDVVNSNEGEITLKKGERKTFDILYEVDSNRTDSYFLYTLGARIDLGGTV